jgi:phage baseplate assembly protein W
VDIAFPYRIDRRGVTAAPASDDEHIAQMLEQLLFTRPGERVNRADFGCGLLDLVFGPSSPEVAAALAVTVSAAIERWLGDVVKVGAVEVAATGSTLQVELSYVAVATGLPATLTLSVPAG